MRHKYFGGIFVHEKKICLTVLLDVGEHQTFNILKCLARLLQYQEHLYISLANCKLKEP